MTRNRKLAVATAVAAAVTLPAAAFANVGGFDDVPDDHTHAAGIGWLVDNGITSGCDADSYCPSENVSRAQMGTFFHRLSGNAAGVAPSVNATTIDGIDSAELVRSYEAVENGVVLNNEDFANVSVDCPAGKVAIGGGYQITVSQNGAISGEYLAGASRATNDLGGWVVSVRSIDGADHDGFVRVYATCAEV